MISMQVLWLKRSTMEPCESYIFQVFGKKLEFKSHTRSGTGPRINKYLISFSLLIYEIFED